MTGGLTEFKFEPIGILSSCFREKFGIPRQPGLVSEARAVLKLRDDPFFKAAVRELDSFSHVWLVFVFHRHDARNWKPSIRPPRLGGAKKVGVLASRSPHRPNPIGISAVELEKIDLDAPGGIEIHLKGVDLLDQTPILDIKPYLPYSDSIPAAKSGWADQEIQRHPVEFSEQALHAISQRAAHGYPELRSLVQGLLELDPRPAFQKRQLPPGESESQGTRYGFRVFDFDVKWEIRGNTFFVLDVVDL